MTGETTVLRVFLRRGNDIGFKMDVDNCELGFLIQLLGTFDIITNMLRDKTIDLLVEAKTDSDDSDE